MGGCKQVIYFRAAESVLTCLHLFPSSLPSRHSTIIVEWRGKRVHYAHARRPREFSALASDGYIEGRSHLMTMRRKPPTPFHQWSRPTGGGQ